MSSGNQKFVERKYNEFETSFLKEMRKNLQEQPDREVFTFLDDNGIPLGPAMRVRDIDLRSRAVATFLQKRGAKPSDRVLLLMNPGRDFITVFCGCLYAGVTAVPCYPPMSEKNVDVLFKIGRDCQSMFVFLSDDFWMMMKDSFADMEQEFGMGKLTWMHLGELDFDHFDQPSDAFVMPEFDPQSVAFLQYTSGSTGSPKGVMVTHSNIIANGDRIRSTFRILQEEVLVTWFPPYHDMGLIGCLITSAVNTNPCVVMSPLTFLKNPVVWLKAIAKYKATISGGPNFAYDLLCRKVTEKDLQELDLSSWSLAFTGAEPVRLRTIDAFCQKFARCGFKRAAFYPCYGMAESTLLVTGHVRFREPVAVWLNSAEYEAGRVVACNENDPGAISLVGCGYWHNTQPIIIVDPYTRQVLPSERIGEVWVERCSSTAKGYWQRPDFTEKTFFGTTEPSTGKQYLRTGDLGFIGQEGSLFISGRIKDLMIIRGRNLYPQDIELTAERCCNAIRKGCSAVFSIEGDDNEEKVVIVAETGEKIEDDWDQIIRRNIAAEHFVHVYDIVLVQPRSINKTTSGKIQRNDTKKRYQSGTLDVVKRSVNKEGGTFVEQRTAPSAPAVKAQTNVRNKSEIVAQIVSRVAAVLERPEQDIDINLPFMEQGLDSLKVQVLVGELSKLVGHEISPTIFFKFPTISALADYLSQEATEKAQQHGRKAQNVGDIAIVGMACRFPGNSTSPAAFWELLEKGTDGVQAISRERMKIFGTNNPKIHSGFIDNVFSFDPEFFGISKREALSMDPQQRIVLQLAVEALEDAGIPLTRVNNTRTGVFLGASTSDFALLQHENDNLKDVHASTGSALSIIANRVSYLLNLHGPSLVVDTACSSSLTAMHLAIQSLASGESSMAIAGGVNLILSDVVSENLRTANFLSPEGRCKTFDAAADGYVRGEGAGVVLLKPLKDAVAENLPIYAVVRGSAVVQDGRSSGLTAPNQQAQEDVIADAFASAGLVPAECDFVECHGTGTFLGDPIECAALGETVGKNRHIISGVNAKCLVGSVKTNIGHLESAAGVAGIIKVALSLKHGIIPPILHFRTPNPHIPFEKLAIEPVTKMTPWPRSNAIAGISSFGFGGTNAHVILQGWNPDTQQQSAINTAETSTTSYTITISARCQESLRAVARSYLQFVKNYTGNESTLLSNLSYTTNLRRTHHAYRLAIVAATRDDFVQQLESYLEPSTAPAANMLFVGPTANTHRLRKVAFVFPGQGADFVTSTRYLYDSNQVFRKSMDRCAFEFEKLETGFFMLDHYSEKPWASLDNKTRQILIFSVQVALANTYISMGIEPAAVVGHSIGEIAAAHIAGSLRLFDAARIVYIRATLQYDALNGKGKMLIARISSTEADSLLQNIQNVDIATLNSPMSTTFSGQPDSLNKLSEELTQRQISHRFLDVESAFHSRQVAPILAKFASKVQKTPAGKLSIPYYSTVTGKHISKEEGATLDTKYWETNMREPVLFSAAVATMLNDGYDLFLEISGRDALTGSIVQTAASKAATGGATLNCIAIPSFRKGDATITPAVAAMYTQGCPVRFETIVTRGSFLANLPTYSWNNEEIAPHYIQSRAVQAPLTDLVDRVKNSEITKTVSYSHVASRTMQFGMFITDVCVRFIGEAFAKMGWTMIKGEVVSYKALAQRLAVAEQHMKLFRRLLSTLASLEHLTLDKTRSTADDETYVVRRPVPGDGMALLSRDRAKYMDFESEATLLERSGNNLDQVLLGNYSALQVLFPEGDMETTEAIYERSAISQLYNTLARACFEVLAKTRKPGLRILEIGAGTGGLTKHVVPQLAEAGVCTEYVFTDVSKLFLLRAQDKFDKYASFMRYSILDVENDPTKQGFAEHSFDIVCAANVVHATKDMRQTLRNVHKLLASGGLFVNLELTAPSPWLDLTFGLTEGWWRFEDHDIRPEYPLIEWATWTKVLDQSGFPESVKLVTAESEDEDGLQTVMVARTDLSVRRSAITATHSTAAESGTTAAFPDQQGAPSQLLPAAEMAEIKKQLYEAQTDEQVRQVISHFICQMVAATLYIPPSKVDYNQRLDGLGMDSLMALELRNAIRRELNIKLPLSALIENPTVNGITDSMVELWKNRDSQPQDQDEEGTSSGEAAPEGQQEQTAQQQQQQPSSSLQISDQTYTACILSISNSTPPYKYKQDDLKEMAVRLYGAEGKQRMQLLKIFESASIDTRYSVLSVEDNFDYKKRFSTLQARNEIYEVEATKMAMASAEGALRAWGRDRKHITHVVSVSTTGNKIPGLEFELVTMLGLNHSVERVGVNFMGCMGWIPGLKTACAFAQLNPRNRVLLVSTEICSTHLEEEQTAENFVGSAIFADGSGAVVIGCDPIPGESPIYEVVRTVSAAVPDSLDKMYWKLTNQGWKLGLSREVPEIIFDNIDEFANRLAGNLSFDQCYWPIHPGGKAILLAIEKALKLKREQTQASWDVLRDYGNMSSSTITFVLNRLREDKMKLYDWACCMVFGPGLVMEGALIRKRLPSNN